jgi:disulfide bond formation protein DsbB
MTQQARHQRKLRNYLLDKKFQLKYTGIVIAITVVLSAVLGYYLYQEIVVSQNTILARDLASDTFVIEPTTPDKLLDEVDQVTNRINEEVTEASQSKVAVVVTVNNAPAGRTADLYQESFGDEMGRKTTVLVVALGIFLFVLAVMWVYLTHRIAGPVYKMKLLFAKVTGENVRVEGRLRKGDELQEAFEAFLAMVERLRDDRREKIGTIGEVIDELEANDGTPKETLQKLKDLKTRLSESIGE